MHYGMYISAAGAHSQGQRLEVLNHNIANVGTTGFKRELGVMQARASEAIEQGLDVDGSTSLNDIGGGVRMTETSTDFSQGPLRQTHNETDFALDQPENFFLLERDGQEFLTRAGNFHFNAEGLLVNDHGYQVLGSDGSAIQIDPLLPFQVTPDGSIMQAGEGRALAIRQPASLGDLVRVGENMFSAVGKAPEEVPAEKRSVRWGYLEMSAVSPHSEMIRLIETTRAYEANIRMIQNHDSVLNNLFSRLLRAQ